MSVQTAIRLDPDVLAQLKELATDGRPMIWHIRKAISNYLEIPDGSNKASGEAAPQLPVVSKPKVFLPPDTSHVCQEMVNKGLSFSEAEKEAEKFCDFYESKGWMVGKNKMKSWQAAVRNWLKSYKEPKGYQTAREKSAARNADIFNYDKATQF